MLALVCVGLTSAAAPPAQGDLSALALLERAADALGGRERVRNLTAIRIGVQGIGVNPSPAQARDPRASANLLLLDRQYLIDLAGSRGRRESSQVSPGPIRFHTLAIATPERARTVDLLKWRSGTDIQSQPPAVGKAALAAWGRMTPHGAVRQALAAAATVKPGPPVERDGRTLSSVTYSDPVGTAVTLLLEEASALPFSVSPGEGPNSTYEYGDYRIVDGLRLPQRLTSGSAALREELRIVVLDLQPRLDDADFVLPAGYSDPPSPGEPRAVKVAEGVYRLDGMPQNYHSAFVVDGSDVSVFDAPVSAQWTELALKVIRATAGDAARVTRVLVSHHHADHTGGLAPYVAAGAVVVCGPAVDEYLRARLPEEHRAAARFEVVSSPRTFAAGSRRIEAHPVPNEHADGSVAFYLPAGGGVLLQGDLFYVPDRGPVPPAFGVTADLARVVDARRLNVRTVIGVHGRQASMAELRASLALRSGLPAPARGQ